MIKIRHRKNGRLLQAIDADTLVGVDLRGADLLRADLAEANLRRARLSRAYLRGANLTEADLSGASLQEADLLGAELANANLRGADLSRARLSHTDLTGADLTGVVVMHARYDGQTRWPAGYDPVAAGAWLEEGKRPDLLGAYKEMLGLAPRWIIASEAINGSCWSRSEEESLGLRRCPFLADPLDWGPQHVDLSIQRTLRECYFRSTHPKWNAGYLKTYLEALRSGDEVLFWCDPGLRSCLSILWALDALAQQAGDFRNARLLLWPTTVREPPSATGARQAFRQLVPVTEVIESLIAIRRHLASDSEVVAADLAALPPSVRAWAAVTDRLVDFLPDERGLDLMDEYLLGALTEDWQKMTAVIMSAIRDGPREHDWGDVWLYERLIELSRARSFDPVSGSSPEGALVEVRFEEGRHFAFSQFRLTALGTRVLAGETDALAHRDIFRWVGGRLITNDRIIRRPG